MKLFLSASALLLATFATSPAAADPAALVGQYEGIIFSNGAKKGSTRFALSSSKKIIGAYVFGGLATREKGTLSRCKLKGTQMTCRWSDAYGNGTLDIRFSDNFCEFDGIWYAKRDRTSPALHHPWTGKRKNCAGLNS